MKVDRSHSKKFMYGGVKRWRMKKGDNNKSIQQKRSKMKSSTYSLEIKWTNAYINNETDNRDVDITSQIK